MEKCVENLGNFFSPTLWPLCETHSVGGRVFWALNASKMHSRSGLRQRSPRPPSWWGPLPRCRPSASTFGPSGLICASPRQIPGYATVMWLDIYEVTE